MHDITVEIHVPYSMNPLERSVAGAILRHTWSLLQPIPSKWVSAGTALGLYRGDGLIEGDTDLDVAMLEERTTDLMQVRGVDRVVVESESEDTRHWIDAIRPNALIKGDDWKGKGWPGEGLGIEVLYLPHTPGVSSTALARVIRER